MEAKDPIISAKAIIHNGDDVLLLLRAGSDLETHNPGQWDLPGGEVDKGESLEDGCIREIWEETKLRLAATALRSLALPDSLREERKQDGRLLQRHIFAIYSDVRLVTLSQEHTDARWVSRYRVPIVMSRPSHKAGFWRAHQQNVWAA
jgi:8-oxo-dGTP diphosphatase